MGRVQFLIDISNIFLNLMRLMKYVEKVEKVLIVIQSHASDTKDIHYISEYKMYIVTCI